MATTMAPTPNRALLRSASFLYLNRSRGRPTIISTNACCSVARPWPQTGRRVIFDAIGGESYQIAVDGFDGASGQISLHIDDARTILRDPLPLPDGTFQFTLDGL